MGNECVGSLSSQADLIGFAVAIILAASLALLLSSTVDKDGRGDPDDVTAEDMRAILFWSGFDPDHDGILMPPTKGAHLNGESTGTDRYMVAVLSTEGASTSCLFANGRYIGNATGLEACSPVRSVTVLILLNGDIRPGTLSVFRTEGRE